MTQFLYLFNGKTKQKTKQETNYNRLDGTPRTNRRCPSCVFLFIALHSLALPCEFS